MQVLSSFSFFFKFFSESTVEILDIAATLSSYLPLLRIAPSPIVSSRQPSNLVSKLIRSWPVSRQVTH